MGRRLTYGGPFGAIDTLGAGDTFTVTTGQGQSTYRVRGVRRPGDPMPPAPEAGGGRLTMLTTSGGSVVPSSIIQVDADLTGPAQPAAQPVATSSLLSAERPMHGDVRALVPLVLWGLALAAGAVAAVWLRHRWGRWQAWVVAVPTLAFLGLSVGAQVAELLPNLI
jgi:hypothetical protein